MDDFFELANEQIREIAEASKGTVQVCKSIASTRTIEISIRFNQLDHVENGLKVRTREKFCITIPDTFPFQYPSVKTLHERFSGFPHVQFKTSLCLYPGPNDWCPGDGMYGFIRRLDSWIRAAAVNNLDPDNAHLHPPIGDFCSDRIFVPVVDTPCIKKTYWVGFAELKKKNSYTEIIGWKKHDETNSQYQIIPAILLNKPLSFEYPRTIHSLLEILKSHSIDRIISDHILTFAKHCYKDTPLTIVLGTQARRIVYNGSILQHLAVLEISAEDTNKLRKLNNIKKATSTKIKWYTVYEMRPEVTKRRDQSSPMSWFKGKHVTIWGCGAIGTHVAESIARVGAKNIYLVDDKQVTPGLLVRQGFEETDIGKPKAQALREKLLQIDSNLNVEYSNNNLICLLICLNKVQALNKKLIRIIDSNLNIEHLNKDLICLLRYLNKTQALREKLLRIDSNLNVEHLNKDLICLLICLNKAQALREKLLQINSNFNVEHLNKDINDLICFLKNIDEAKKTDIIIDCTASSNMQTALEYTLKNKVLRPIIASIGIDNHASSALATLSMPNHSGGTFDLIRKLKLKACHTSNLSQLLESFWPKDKPNKPFSPEPGCSEPTFIGSYADVTGLSSRMLNSIAQFLKDSKDPQIGAGWLLEKSGFIHNFTWSENYTVKDKELNYSIRISPHVIQKMCQLAKDSIRKAGKKIETGGLVFGELNEAAGVLWVTDIEGPPPDSHASEEHFTCGIEGMKELTEKKSKMSRKSVDYIGSWHTHPTSGPNPSNIDIETVKKNLSQPETKQKMFLLLILSGNPDDPFLGVHVFKKKLSGIYSTKNVIKIQSNSQFQESIHSTSSLPSNTILRTLFYFGRLPFFMVLISFIIFIILSFFYIYHLLS